MNQCLSIFGAVVAVAMYATSAGAIPFVLTSSTAVIVQPANITSPFYQANDVGTDQGTAAGLYTFTQGGTEAGGYYVEIFFGVNPQPVLTGAFYKASNGYLSWDLADVTPFNAGVYTSLILWNGPAPFTGLQNSGNGNYHNLSHAGLFGTPGTSRVPDAGSSIMLLGAALAGLAGIRSRLVK